MDTQQLIEVLQAVEAIKSKPNEWLPVFAAIGGAFVGAISSFFPALLLERHRRKVEASTVKAALVAEISSLLKIIKARQYIDDVKNIIEDFKKTPDMELSYKVQVPEHYSRVYQSHINKLGLLKTNEVTKIIEFYQMIDAVVQDLKPGGCISEGDVGIDAYHEMLEIFEVALSIGSEIIKENS
jgi:hypothetical protein